MRALPWQGDAVRLFGYAHLRGLIRFHSARLGTRVGVACCVLCAVCRVLRQLCTNPSGGRVLFCVGVWVLGSWCACRAGFVCVVGMWARGRCIVVLGGMMIFTGAVVAVVAVVAVSNSTNSVAAEDLGIEVKGTSNSESRETCYLGQHGFYELSTAFHNLF